MSLKKKIIIMCSICVVVLISGIIIDKNLSKNYFMEVKYTDIIEKINNKEDFVVCLSQTTCSHCKLYKPKLEKVANELKIDIYYLEVNLLSEEEEKEFNKYINFSGTPTTVFIKNGEEKTAATRINGDASIDKIKAKLKSNGFIK